MYLKVLCKELQPAFDLLQFEFLFIHKLQEINLENRPEIAFHNKLQPITSMKLNEVLTSQKHETLQPASANKKICFKNFEMCLTQNRDK